MFRILSGKITKKRHDWRHQSPSRHSFFNKNKKIYSFCVESEKVRASDCIDKSRWIGNYMKFCWKGTINFVWVYTNGFWNFYSFFIDLKASPSYFLLCMMCKIQDTKKKSKPRKELYKISVFQLRHNLRQFSFSPEKLWSHEYNLTPTSGFTQKKIHSYHISINFLLIYSQNHQKQRIIS